MALNGHSAVRPRRIDVTHVDLKKLDKDKKTSELATETCLGVFDYYTDKSIDLNEKSIEPPVITTDRLYIAFLDGDKVYKSTGDYISRGTIKNMYIKEKAAGQAKQVEISGFKGKCDTTYVVKVKVDHAEIPVAPIIATYTTKKLTNCEGDDSHKELVWNLCHELNRNSHGYFKAEPMKKWEKGADDSTHDHSKNHELASAYTDLTATSFINITFAEVEKGTYNSGYVPNRFLEGQVFADWGNCIPHKDAKQAVGDGLDVQYMEYQNQIEDGIRRIFVPKADINKQYCEFHIDYLTHKDGYTCEASYTMFFLDTCKEVVKKVEKLLKGF